MAILLVDDRDGRIVAELQNQEDVQRVLEAWAQDGGGLPDNLCMIEVDSRPGAIIGTDTSVKIRPLS